MSSTVYLGPRPPPRGYPGEGPVVDRFAKWRAKLGRDLLSAAEEGNAAVVKVCLEQKADPSVISLDSGRSPLHGAAASGNLEVMRDLIHASVRARVDLSLADNSKRTALDEALDVPQRLHMPADLAVPLLATAKEAPEIVTELQTSLPKWRQALLTVLSCCTTPLPLVHEAALASVLEAWCFTGARGGPPSKVQELRRALFTSVANNNRSAVEALAIARADLNRLDPRSRRTALELSEALLHHGVTDVLRQYGAKTERNPHFEEWALCLAAANGSVQGTTRWLGHGEVDWRDPPPSMRSTALMYAAAGGHSDVVMSLLEAQACPALVDQKQRAPFEMAREVGAEALARYLQRTAEHWRSSNPSSMLAPAEWQKPSGWREAAPEVDPEGSKLAGLTAAVQASRSMQGKGKKVIIEVLRATGLQAGLFLHSLDPFVKVRVGQEVQETQYVVSIADPEWNEQFEFFIMGTEVIIFSVWDYDLTGGEDHDFICRAELPLKHHVKELYKGQKVMLELHLENKTHDDDSTLFVSMQLADFVKGPQRRIPETRRVSEDRRPAPPTDRKSVV